MENELLKQLGINWQLLLSQMVNFFILLVVLTFFVYKPLLKVIKERNSKIKEGLDKAEEAGVRLKEIDNIGKEKMKETELRSIAMLKETESKAKILDREIQDKAEKKQKEMDVLMQESLKKQKEEARAMVMKDAMEMVKKTIAKTVELNPEMIDEALIKKAVLQIKNEK